MEEKSKIIKIVLIGIASVILVIIVAFFALSANRSDKNETNKTETLSNKDNGKKQDDVEFEVKNKEITVKESSKENELVLGEWTMASRKVTSNFSYEEYKKISYIEVPTSVTKIIRGQEAENILKDWYKKKPNYSYEEPRTGMEWAIIEYKVDLSDVKIKEGSDGIDIALDCTLTGPKGGTSITHGKITCILSPYSMSDDVRAKTPGIYTGRIMAKIPVGYSDYTIQLGCKYDNTKEDNKGTIAYFKGQ